MSLCSSECLKEQNNLKKCVGDYNKSYTPDDKLNNMIILFTSANKWIKLEHNGILHIKEMTKYKKTLRSKLYQFHNESFVNNISIFNKSNHPTFYYNKFTNLTTKFLGDIYNINFCIIKTKDNKQCQRRKDTTEKNWICEQHRKRNEKLINVTNKFMIRDLTNIVISYLG
jgi:hypothetical protein